MYSVLGIYPVCLAGATSKRMRHRDMRYQTAPLPYPLKPRKYKCALIKLLRPIRRGHIKAYSIQLSSYKKIKSLPRSNKWGHIEADMPLPHLPIKCARLPCLFRRGHIKAVSLCLYPRLTTILPCLFRRGHIEAPILHATAPRFNHYPI